MFARFVQPSRTFVQFKLTPLQALLTLVLADLSFMLIHVLHIAQISLFSSWRFAIGHDRGFASSFLYVQEVTVLLIAMVLFMYHQRLFSFGVLAAMFTYIFLDDAFLLHEHLGLVLAQGLNLPALGSMRPRDLGEILTFASFGVIFSSLFAFAYLRGGAVERSIALTLFGLLAALAFCGVGFDAMHMALDQPSLQMPFALLEDGGEMLVISTFLWYTLRLLRTAQQKALTR